MIFFFLLSLFRQLHALWIPNNFHYYSIADLVARCGFYLRLGREFHPLSNEEKHVLGRNFCCRLVGMWMRAWWNLLALLFSTHISSRWIWTRIFFKWKWKYCTKTQDMTKRTEKSEWKSIRHKINKYMYGNK